MMKEFVGQSQNISLLHSGSVFTNQKAFRKLLPINFCVGSTTTLFATIIFETLIVSSVKVKFWGGGF